MGLAERRLDEVARQWRCPPAPAPPAAEPDGLPDARGGWEAIAGADDGQGALRVAPWSRSALRGLTLIVALAVTVAAYWAWSGRPRAVAQAPTVVTLGAPVAVPEPVPSPILDSPPDAAVPSSPAAVVGPAPVATAIPQVVVHVTGLVARPGLVRLPLGARVADALAEAGGVTRRRAADTVNLARVLVDGEQVVVGVPGAPGTVAAAATGSPAGNPMGSPAAVIDLNTATAGALEGLPGVGPVIAARIVEWRTANGSFRSVEELGEVSGIGDAILTQVRARVRV